MTRVVQIQRQGKVKDASAPAAASGLPAEEIETKVALIQALNPLGLHTVSEALEGPRWLSWRGHASVGRAGTPARSAVGSNEARSTWAIRNCPSPFRGCATERRTARSP